MFNWSISLTDKAVLMLMGFHTTEPDKDGCQFHGVRDLIGNAWDIRAARKLCEDGLLLHESLEKGDRTPGKGTRWTITDKGRLIALAILEDTETLQKLHLRAMGPSIQAMENEGHKEWLQKKEARRKAA